ncbi:hypothetical protein IWZ00DRAFT_489742 [Phyllosticta capitalensis]
MCENDAKTVEQAIGRRPAPPVLERDGFALCDNVFTVGGYERVQGKRLAQLFNPRICKTGHLFTQASNEAATLFKKNFFAAQLRHHDIKFKASATAAELRGLLESAVHQGQCDWPPMSTVLLQRQMLSDYEPLRREWQREIAVWEAKKKQVEVEQWKKRKQHEAKQLEEQRRAREEYWNFGDARSRAKIDMKRFVREYYLSEDGKEPDRTKTPEPLILGITGQDKFLLVHSVPGLCTAPCSNLHGFGLDICVGWDRTEVDRMAEERTKMVEAKRKREEEEEKREEEEKEKAKLEPHRQYMAQRASTTAPQSFEMANCIGSYIIRCDTMNEYYNGRQRLSLDVSPGVEGTLIASNFLGVIGGTMLLGTAEDKLEELAISLDADSSDPQTPSGTTTMTPTRSASKPPAQSAKQPRTKPAAQRGTSSASVLRQCPGAHEIEEHTQDFRIEEGHIDFADDGCTVFEGRFYNNFMGKNVQFEGFKISDKPLEQQTPWKELSERNYGRY